VKKNKGASSQAVEPDPCPPRFVHVEKMEGNNTCAPRCDVDVFFRQEDKHFAKVLFFFSSMSNMKMLLLFKLLLNV
jgi:hypothetical protein